MLARRSRGAGSLALLALLLAAPAVARARFGLFGSSGGGATEVTRVQDKHRAGVSEVSGLCHADDVRQDYSWMDVVIVMVAPVCTTKEVVSTLRYNFQFRRVYFIVKDERFCPYLREMADDGYIVCLDENKVLPGVTHSSLMKESDGLIKNSQQSNRVGWYLQQYLKLGVSLHIEDLSDYYLVWDADNLSTRPIKLFNGAAPNGRRRVSFCANPVSHKSTSYAKFYQMMLGKPLLRPSGLKSLDATPEDSRVPGKLHNFVCGYMVMHRPHVKSMLEEASATIRQRYGGGETRGFPWDIHRLANEVVPNAWFSEYDTYGSYVRSTYPEEFHVDYGLVYNRNAAANIATAPPKGGGKRKGGGDDRLPRFSCCLTHKRICSLGKLPASGGVKNDGVHIVIWEEHKMRYRGGQSQCTDALPAALERAVDAVGHGVTLSSAKTVDAQSRL